MSGNDWFQQIAESLLNTERRIRISPIEKNRYYVTFFHSIDPLSSNHIWWFHSIPTDFHQIIAAKRTNVLMKHDVVCMLFDVYRFSMEHVISLLSIDYNVKWDALIVFYSSIRQIS